MPDQPKVSLNLPLYSILRKNGRLAIGGGKAMLWSSVPRVNAFMELFRDQCDNFVIIDTRDRLRDLVAKATASGPTLDMERGENEKVIVVRLDQLVDQVGGNPEEN